MDVYTDVVERLNSMGYAVTESPDAAVTYSINRAAEKIKANINHSEIPNDLYYTWVDMAAGMFLYDKKAVGQLTDAAFDFTAPAKKITEGDVSVEFTSVEASNTPEARFERLLNGMINPPQSIFAAFRRFKW